MCVCYKNENLTGCFVMVLKTLRTDLRAQEYISLQAEAIKNRLHSPVNVGGCVMDSVTIP